VLDLKDPAWLDIAKLISLGVAFVFSLLAFGPRIGRYWNISWLKVEPEIDIIIGHGNPYEEVRSFEANRMRTVRVGVKNVGGKRLTNCKLEFERILPGTVARETYFSQKFDSLEIGTELHVGVAYYNEPLSPDKPGSNDILLCGNFGGGYDTAPPKLSGEDGGSVILTTTCAESPRCQKTLILWLKDGSFQWKAGI
jgi:hypothetical protein